MGTRSITIVYDEDNQRLMNMYRQFDGYPDGHGFDLVEFLKGDHGPMGYLAAALVEDFKPKFERIHLVPVFADRCAQDYEYHIHWNNDELHIQVFYCGCNMFGMSGDKKESIFEGNLKAFEKFCAFYPEEVGKVIFPTSYDDPVDQTMLKEALREGIMEVTFTKKNGDERVMKCTLSPLIIPKEDQPKEPGEGEFKVIPAPTSLRVYDTELGEWRAFRWDSIKGVEYV